MSKFANWPENLPRDELVRLLRGYANVSRMVEQAIASVFPAAFPLGDGEIVPADQYIVVDEDAIAMARKSVAEIERLRADLFAAEEERDHLVALLRGLLFDMHPTTAGTSRRGGIGGMTVTTHCDVNQYHEPWQQHFMDRVHAAIGAAHKRDERDGTTRLGDALKAAKSIPEDARKK